MTIHITCECGKILQASDDLVGRPAICPACQRLVTLPEPEAPAQPPGPIPGSVMDVCESAVTDSLPKEVPVGGPLTSRLARWSMILGVGSWLVPVALGIGVEILESDPLALFLVIAPLLLGIPATVLGTWANRAIRQQPDAIRGKGLANTGQFLGALAVAIWLIVGVLLQATSNARQAAARIQSVSNLKQIGIACHVFHDEHFHFPSDNSNLSWRVQILPSIGEERVRSQNAVKQL